MSAAEKPIVVMKRYEMKYIMSPEQTEYFKKSVEGHMKIDKFGLTSIASLYYDTPNYRLIRTSVEKPAFKEKIRLRSYGIATNSSPVFLELTEKIQDGLDSPIPVLQEILERIPGLLAVDEVFPRVHVDDDDVFGAVFFSKLLDTSLVFQVHCTRARSNEALG